MDEINKVFLAKIFYRIYPLISISIKIFQITLCRMVFYSKFLYLTYLNLKNNILGIFFII